jgi:hypothetical protein
LLDGTAPFRPNGIDQACIDPEGAVSISVSFITLGASPYFLFAARSFFLISDFPKHSLDPLFFGAAFRSQIQCGIVLISVRPSKLT